MNNLQNQIPSSANWKKHQNDAISVSTWVESMSHLGEDNPVIYFKNQGECDTENILLKEDICLVLMMKFQVQMIHHFAKEKICIDETHGTNSYDFELHTLLTVDEFGAGCPVSHCFSNRKDHVIVEVFFNSIKRKVGVIDVKVYYV